VDFLIAAKLSDLLLGFSLVRRASEALGDSLALDLIGKPQVRLMAGVTRGMAMAVGIAATTSRTRDGTAAQVAQLADLRDQIAALGF
jgi:hypothetical protein